MNSVCRTQALNLWLSADIKSPQRRHRFVNSLYFGDFAETC